MPPCYKLSIVETLITAAQPASVWSLPAMSLLIRFLMRVSGVVRAVCPSVVCVTLACADKCTDYCTLETRAEPYGTVVGVSRVWSVPYVRPVHAVLDHVRFAVSFAFLFAHSCGGDVPVRWRAGDTGATLAEVMSCETRPRDRTCELCVALVLIWFIDS